MGVETEREGPERGGAGGGAHPAARARQSGDVKPVGEGVCELRIPYGPGYRVYYITEGDLLILLLTGGAKPTRQADINEAKRLARAWREERT